MRPAAPGSAPGWTRRARSPPRRTPVVWARGSWRARWRRAGTGRRTASGCAARRTRRRDRRRSSICATRARALGRAHRGRSARSGSATHSATLMVGSRLANGSWKTICRSARTSRKARARQLAHRPPQPHDLAGRTRAEPQQRPRQRRFAGAGFADDAQRFAGADLERHVDSTATRSRARRSQPSLQPVPHVEIADLRAASPVAAGVRRRAQPLPCAASPPAARACIHAAARREPALTCRVPRTLPAAHDQHLVGQRGDHAHVVGDQASAMLRARP